MSIGGINGLGGYSAYTYTPVYASRRSQLSPVEAVKQAPEVHSGKTSIPYSLPAGQAAGAQLPEIRQGADPVAMAVRGRIEYLNPEQVDALIAQKNGLSAEETSSPAEVMEEGECQTCKERKYQDGSNDPGVSFKTPAHIAPEQSAAVVRGHEMEHVTREQAKALREDREVVQQSVALHTAICPECGGVYVSGGTTRTTTRANQEAVPQEQQNAAFEAVA